MTRAPITAVNIDNLQETYTNSVPQTRTRSQCAQTTLPPIPILAAKARYWTAASLLARSMRMKRETMRKRVFVVYSRPDTVIIAGRRRRLESINMPESEYRAVPKDEARHSPQTPRTQPSRALLLSHNSPTPGSPRPSLSHLLSHSLPPLLDSRLRAAYYDRSGSDCAEDHHWTSILGMRRTIRTSPSSTSVNVGYSGPGDDCRKGGSRVDAATREAGNQ